MSLLSINIKEDGISIHGGKCKDIKAIADHILSTRAAPLIFMVHGYRYQPGARHACPHQSILSLEPVKSHRRSNSWPLELGVCAKTPSNGLAIAIGWDAIGTLWDVYARARRIGQVLGELIDHIRTRDPERNISAIGHSLGARVLLSAVAEIHGPGFDRVILLSGAEFASFALDAINSQSGRSTEFFNIVSRENDLFEFLFECLVSPPKPGDISIGQLASDRCNLLTIQIDHAPTLDRLGALGFDIPASGARVCHWSSYLRPGLFELYRELFEDPVRFSMARLKHALPDPEQTRWSRLLPTPINPQTLFGRNAAL